MRSEDGFSGETKSVETRPFARAQRLECCFVLGSRWLSRFWNLEVDDTG